LVAGEAAGRHQVLDQEETVVVLEALGGGHRSHLDDAVYGLQGGVERADRGEALGRVDVTLDHQQQAVVLLEGAAQLVGDRVDARVVRVEGLGGVVGLDPVGAHGQQHRDDHEADDHEAAVIEGELGEASHAAAAIRGRKGNWGTVTSNLLSEYLLNFADREIATALGSMSRSQLRGSGCAKAPRNQVSSTSLVKAVA